MSLPRVDCGQKSQRGQSLTINPVADDHWDALLATHSKGSVFHTSAWARVLHDTYGHQPTYFCNVNDGVLRGLLPVMEVSSRLTGLRGVSLPFTDFCSSLSVPQLDWDPYVLAMAHGRERAWKYLECRSTHRQWPGASPSLSFYGHVIHLDKGPAELFKGFKGAVRTCIRKAQTLKVQVEFRSDPEAMKGFYSLHCLTRRRHGLPPQPFRFFENIGRHLLGTGHGVVISAFVGCRAVAAAVFLHYQQEALFKFGASDFAFQGLRPNNLIMWEAMRHYASNGFKLLHFGRTSFSNSGLRRFKCSFGAVEQLIDYCKYDFKRAAFVSDIDYSEGPASKVFKWLSVPALQLSGRLLYPHLD
jgi:hypothetical protein